jgi:hypothetical protein
MVGASKIQYSAPSDTRRLPPTIPRISRRSIILNINFRQIFNMALPAIDFADSAAFVTGGSSGIDRAIAQELVDRGVRQLVIIGQDESKLQNVASDISLPTLA